MIKNANGFTLVEVMVAAALLGGLSLFFVNLVSNMNKAQSNSQSKTDEIELRTALRLLLDDERFCRVSLAGNGNSGFPTTPVKFYKKDIDQLNEGLNIALFLSNQAGDTRTLKKFNGEAFVGGGQDLSRYGKLKIKSMKLIMNNGVGANYANSPTHTDFGIIRTVFEKMNETPKKDHIIDLDILLSMSTGKSPDLNGQTRILSCTRGEKPKSFAISTCRTVSAPATHNYSLLCSSDEIVTQLGLSNGWGGSEWNKHQYVSSIRCCKGSLGFDSMSLKNCNWKSVVAAHNQDITCDPGKIMNAIRLNNAWTGSEWNKHQNVSEINCCEISL